MKLKNKKTEEIGELQITEKHCAVAVGNGTASCEIEIYNSLAKLNEEWEDYEEPKGIQCIYYVNHFDAAKIDGVIVGFETKEEAEKAVEKLKAWKRLKDKGFRFIDHIDRDTGQGMTRYEWNGYIDGEDLDLLFGGEE